MADQQDVRMLPRIRLFDLGYEHLEEGVGPVMDLRDSFALLRGVPEG